MSYNRFCCLPRWVAALLVVACFSSASAQEVPIEAQLAHPLAGDTLAVGSTFALQILASWQQAECRLAPGAVLHATVTSVTRPNHHTQGITFVIQVPCGDGKPLGPIVTSLLAAPKVEEEVEEFPGFTTSGGIHQTRVSSASLNPLDSARPLASTVRNTTIRTDQLPKTATLGEVWHLPHIKLVLPSGKIEDSAIATDKPPLGLPAKTIFILQVARAADQLLHAAATVANHPVHEHAHVPGPFIGACKSGQCTVDSSPFGAASFGLHQVGDVDFARLGMGAESEAREIYQMQQSTTVHFLSDAELLLTFPAHGLLRRSGDERPTDNPQPVRAVLFNTETRSVEHIEDWIVDDHNPYIWSLGRNMLVHKGHFLKVYGPGLQELASFGLDLPLASLRASPDGKHVLLGELHELHSLQDHLMLVETLPRGPEEEVQWSLLDEHLERISTLGSSSNFLPTPILLNDGLVELRKGVEAEWFLLGTSWANNSGTVLGSLRSACFPVLNDISPNLMAATTCDTSGRAMHTVLTRKDGVPVIEQTSTRQDLAASFAASSVSARVALMLTRAKEGWDQGRTFTFSMVKAQRIEVFGSDDGSLLASMPLPAAEHCNNAFALSPNGSALAFAAGHHLSLYELR